MRYPLFIKILVSIGAYALQPLGYAADLMSVYQQALQTDPTLQKAHFSTLSAKEIVPQGRAGLLPTLSAQAGMASSRTQIHAASFGMPDNTTHASSSSYSINLSQPLFNLERWMTLRQADAADKSADAAYSAAQQDLMLRVATAYFKILAAQDQLRITLAQKKLLAEQLDQANQRYQVGLDTITEVYNAQAQYDITIADEISKRNELANSYEDLRAITGQLYQKLAVLKRKIPLVTPKPAVAEQWVNLAQQQNWSLREKRFTADAAREKIKAVTGKHFPTLAATASYENTKKPLAANPDASTSVRSEASMLGLNVSIPLYSGGLVNSQVRQAQYNYQVATADMELYHQTIVTETRKFYGNILALISKLKADKASIRSTKSAFESNLAAYQVGTKTNIDVLDMQKKLYDAQREYSKDQYDYLLATLTLKNLAGTLSEKDLLTINTWLKPVNAKAETQSAAITLQHS